MHQDFLLRLARLAAKQTLLFFTVSLVSGFLQQHGSTNSYCFAVMFVHLLQYVLTVSWLQDSPERPADFQIGSPALSGAAGHLAKDSTQYRRGKCGQ